MTTMSGIANQWSALGLLSGREPLPYRFVYPQRDHGRIAFTRVTLNDVDWPEIRYAEVLFNYAETANETENPVRDITGIEKKTSANARVLKLAVITCTALRLV